VSYRDRLLGSADSESGALACLAGLAAAIPVPP
jgi:hypothetical protein